LSEIAVDQLGKIELKFVLFAGGVGTLHFTQFALKAQLHQFFDVVGRQLENVLVLVIDQFEHDRKQVAVLKTHSATVTQGKRSSDFFVQILWGTSI